MYRLDHTMTKDLLIDMKIRLKNIYIIKYSNKLLFCMNQQSNIVDIDCNYEGIIKAKKYIKLDYTVAVSQLS